MKKTNDLHAFLRKHGAVRKFKANLKAKVDHTYGEMVEMGLEDDGVISCGFVWSDTPEGHNYWEDLKQKYTDQFKTN